MESYAELSDRIGHTVFCVMLAHETLQDAGFPDWDEAMGRVETALIEGDCTCQCD